MGAGDKYKERRVLTKFEGEPRGLLAAYDKIQDKQKQTSAGWGSGFKSLTDGINKGVDGLGKLGLAFEGINKIVSFAREAIRGYAEDLRLEATNAGRSIERLQEATRGLVDEDTLNQFAAKAANGALKLTQTQLETLGQAAVALRDKGYDLTESLERLTDAAVTGRTRGLKELGIEVEEGSSKFETLTNMMGELNKKIGDSHGPINQQADDIERLATQWDNLVDSVKNYTAQAALALADEVDITNPEALYGKVWNEEVFQPFVGAFRHQMVQHEFASGVLRGRAAIEEMKTIEMPEEIVKPRSDAEKKRFADQIATRMAEELLRTFRSLPYERNVGVTHDPFATLESTQEYIDSIRAKELEPGFSYFQPGAGPESSALGRRAQEEGLDIENLSAIIRTNDELERRSELTRQWFAETEQYAKQRSFLQMLGLDKPDAMDFAISSLHSFTDAYKQTLRAIGEGGQSAGQIFKKGLGIIVGGIGDKLAAFSAAEAVESAANFATYNFVGGASHAAASALYAGGAVAAYAAASRLGAPSGGGSRGSAPSGGGGGGASAGAGYGGGGGGNRVAYAGPGGGERIFVLQGDSWGYDSPRMRQMYLEKALSDLDRTDAGAHR